jgi:hypothetical protein
MLAKFISRLTETQFFIGLFLLYIIGGKGFELLFGKIFPNYFISGMVPTILLIAPIFLIRFKAKPEEFPHLKGREKYIPYYFAGIILMAVIFTIVRNYYFKR